MHPILRRIKDFFTFSFKNVNFYWLAGNRASLNELRFMAARRGIELLFGINKKYSTDL